jgi:3-(3-hydroxy-phenyl)propionate hydroxylase
MALSYDSDGAAIQRHAFAYHRSADQDAPTPVRHPVVVVGAGPVGLSLAIDLAQRLQPSGQRVLLLDNDHKLSTGSRAICFSKRALEIWDRLGVGDAMCAKGVEWNVGKVFFRNELLYQFNLLPEPGHERPAFINLQQYYAEAYLAVRAAELPNIEIRWHNTVVACEPHDDHVRLGIDTPDGRYQIEADHVAACDGSRSPLRAMLGLESKGRVFRDRFLIADVRMAVNFPAERWFWFDPPFHANQSGKDGKSTPSSVLLHRQPDGVWRIDFQLGWDADPEAEKQPERIKPRVDAMMRAALGREVPFELEWASVYTFACQRMERFVHGRVVFAGDAAHGVSPFGARGANSGVQDADNLAWKLDLVLRGVAPRALLDTYGPEREYAADENLLNSTRATDFITPKSAISRLFRDATLDLARSHPFARRIVNSGRLSVPATLLESTLNTPDRDDFKGGVAPGAPAIDAPLPGGAWLLRQASGKGFMALVFGDDAGAAAAVKAGAEGLVPVQLIHLPAEGLAAERYDARPGTVVLLRPDQHVCARWRAATAGDVANALRRALALTAQP